MIVKLMKDDPFTPGKKTCSELMWGEWRFRLIVDNTLLRLRRLCASMIIQDDCRIRRYESMIVHDEYYIG